MAKHQQFRLARQACLHVKQVGRPQASDAALVRQQGIEDKKLRIAAAKLLSRDCKVKMADGRIGKVETIHLTSGSVDVLIQGTRRSVAFAADSLTRV